MLETLRENDWEALLRHVKNGRCTPIIGDGVLEPVGLDKAKIAQQLAATHNYPFAAPHTLPKVAQFLAVGYEGDRLMYTYDVTDMLKNARAFEAGDETDIHNALARLDLPVYITTNYDDRIVRALEAQGKTPQRVFYRWNEDLRQSHGAGTQLPRPDPSNPLVYHLFGYDEVPESLVLTEDDLLDYLSSMAAIKAVPASIRGEALARNALLFIGHRLDTLAFRTLLRSILHAATSMFARNWAFQVKPSSGDEAQLSYLKDYCEKLVKIRTKVYWCAVEDFASELSVRWEEYRNG